MPRLGQELGDRSHTPRQHPPLAAMSCCPACRGAASSARRVYGDVMATRVACLHMKVEDLFAMGCGHLICHTCLRTLDGDKQGLEASLLPPTLATASKALGRMIMPAVENGAFKLQLLDLNEAAVVMNAFKVPVEAYKHMQGKWTAVSIASQGPAHALPVGNQTLFIAFAATVPLTLEDQAFFQEWEVKHNAEEWPRARTVTETFDPADRRKILTVSSHVHKDLADSIVQFEDYQRVWEAQREAAQRRAQAPEPVVEIGGHKV